MVILLVRVVHRFTTSIYIYIYLYIGLVGDIGRICANGNMGALCPVGGIVGTIGPSRTKITNRTNSTHRTD